jgi:hypothetical protein
MGYYEGRVRAGIRIQISGGKRRRVIPKGFATIARRFNVGNWIHCPISPAGTAENFHSNSAVPAGLKTFQTPSRH